MIRIAYGLPERSVSEPALLACLQGLAVNFDESPDTLKAVLGPTGTGVRWLAFTSSPLRGGRLLSGDHFTEGMQDEVAEMIVVTRENSVNQWVTRFEYLGRRCRWFELVAEGHHLTAYGDLPSSGRRDGQLHVVGLSSLGLPIDDPFAVLERPTHEVLLRSKRKRPAQVHSAPWGGETLQVHPQPAPLRAHRAKETASFPYRLRDVLGLEDAEAFFAEVERLSDREFEESRSSLVARLAAHRGLIDSAVVELLRRPSSGARTIDLCLQALGLLGTGAEILAEFVGRPEGGPRAVAALARQGEQARPALAWLLSSKEPAQSVAAAALSELLDSPQFEPLRAIQTARSTLSLDTIAHIRSADSFDEIGDGCAHLDARGRAAVVSLALEGAIDVYQLEALFEAFPDASAAPAVGLFLFEQELPPANRWSLLVAAGGAYGASLRDLAALLVRHRYPGDRTLEAIANGAKLPSIDADDTEEQWLARAQVRGSALRSKPTAKKGRGANRPKAEKTRGPRRTSK